MSMKEFLRQYTRTSHGFEKLWLWLQWKKTNFYAWRYSDYEYAQKLWKKHAGRGMDFSEPKTFDEKLWTLKLSNRDPLLTVCSDKHEARGYVEACGFADILKKEIACYESADEIPFEQLPTPCYLKCNHASGMNLIWRGGICYMM